MRCEVQIRLLPASGGEIFAPMTPPGLPGLPVGWGGEGGAGAEERGGKEQNKTKKKKGIKDQNVCLDLIFFLPEILPGSETKGPGSLPDPEFNFPAIDYFQT